MIIHLNNDIKDQHKQVIITKAEALGFQITEVKTQGNSYLVGVGKSEIDLRALGHMEGIVDIFRVSDDYKLVSRKWRTDPMQIDLGDGVIIGEGNFSVMAGPCSIESEEQIIKIIQHLKDNNVQIMRGGVFKPRSSPYSFRGSGISGLEIWSRHAREAGIKIISEVMQVSQIESMYDYVDIYQVGARNTQNFSLLDELGKVDKPVLIKRGISGTIDELLYSAEYVFSAGNEKLMLCERGIRTYENSTRNTMDINAIPVLKEKSHLPVIADPSHAIGIRRFVSDIALASVMAGADGVIYESHFTPEKAMSDAQQTLDFTESEDLIKNMRATYSLRQSFKH